MTTLQPLSQYPCALVLLRCVVCCHAVFLYVRYVEMLEQLAVDPFFLKIQQRTEPDSEKEYDRWVTQDVLVQECWIGRRGAGDSPSSWPA